MNANDALKGLPHGPEFRFVDRVIELEPGVRGTGEYRVRGDEPFLKGHFPGEPIMPGVLLVEAAAQLAGIVAQCDPNHAPLTALKLTALRNVKILGTARPGETIRIRAEITGRMGGLIQAKAEILLGEVHLVSADFTLAGVPPTGGLTPVRAPQR
jgi:3-hydroxyacyl-[acyl-carrier-protein] dehydratase